MDIQATVREFKYGSVALPDPNIQFSLQQVRDFFSVAYPQILNAEIEGPEVKGNRNIYTFRRAVGTKGARARIDAAFTKQVSDLLALDRIGWFSDTASRAIQQVHGHLLIGEKPSDSLMAQISELHQAQCSKEARPA